MRIGILVFDDVEELDFVGPLEVFGMAPRFGAQCETVVLAEEARAIRCRHGLLVVPAQTLATCPAVDLLVVPGGLGARTHARENRRLLDFIRRQEGFVASVCTGALILAAAGVLENRTATTHHAALDLLRAYPGVRVKEGVRFVIEERLATSAGVSAGIDLALALAGSFWGGDVARQIANALEWPGAAEERRTCG